MELDKFRVESMPPSCYYIPEFITESEEKLLLHNIERTSVVRWTKLKNRRLINYGGIPTQKGMIAEDIPSYLQSYLDKVNSLKIFGDVEANHILLNEYTAGQGIMPHFDGPLFYPTITTVSIGSHTILEFYQSQDMTRDVCFKVLVEPRSLLILKDELYSCYMHAISEVDEDDISDVLIKNKRSSEQEICKRGTRYSLTIRNVPKTTKFKLKLGK
ncbi:CLUMA_CG014375, isoform A [Clunio marinus]|uniref:CLUMA_CG014375, isoform A n=1 Tax=Clunio marinus TaxID=568069 RepID=A0A1J1IN24_9DIPT|nr:CLUMA_CG014375, isoform A [Clunio marinus]